MRMSKISLTDEAGGRGGVDAISAIYSRVRDDATARRKATYAWAELTALAGQDFTVRPHSRACCISNLPAAAAMLALLGNLDSCLAAATTREAACWPGSCLADSTSQKQRKALSFPRAAQDLPPGIFRRQNHGHIACGGGPPAEAPAGSPWQAPPAASAVQLTAIRWLRRMSFATTR